MPAGKWFAMRIGGRTRVALLVLGSAIIIFGVPVLSGFRWWGNLVVLALAAALLRVLVVCPDCGKSRAGGGWTRALDSKCPFCGQG
jgi:hypothetical protein